MGEARQADWQACIDKTPATWLPAGESTSSAPCPSHQQFRWGWVVQVGGGARGEGTGNGGGGSGAGGGEGGRGGGGDGERSGLGATEGRGGGGGGGGDGGGGVGERLSGRSAPSKLATASCNMLGTLPLSATSKKPVVRTMHKPTRHTLARGPAAAPATSVGSSWVPSVGKTARPRAPWQLARASTRSMGSRWRSRALRIGRCRAQLGRSLCQANSGGSVCAFGRCRAQLSRCARRNGLAEIGRARAARERAARAHVRRALGGVPL